MMKIKKLIGAILASAILVNIIGMSASGLSLDDFLNPQLTMENYINTVNNISGDDTVVLSYEQIQAVEKVLEHDYAEPVITLSQDIAKVNKGNTFQLSASITPAKLFDSELKWSSNNPTVASVDDSGMITANSEGTAYITAYIPNRASATCKLTVTDFYDGPFNFQEDELKVSVGRTYTISGDVNLYTMELTWVSSDNSIATVDKYGNVTGVSAGTAYVTASTVSGYSDSAIINVKMPPTSVTISQTSLSMGFGETYTLSATAQPEGLVDRPAIRWSSNNEAVATVDRQGNVTAVGEGVTQIIAKTYNNVETCCVVSVADYNAPFVFQRHSINLTVGGCDTITADIDLNGRGLTWTSTDTSVVTVDSSGVVRGKAAGYAAVTAKTANGYSDTCMVYVYTSPTGITISNETLSMEKGETYQLTATVLPLQYVTCSDVTWISINEDVATVNSEGKVTAVGKGNAKIIASTDNGMSVYCYVTVTEPIKVMSVDAAPRIIKIYVGETAKITPIIEPAEAAATAQISYISHDPSVATVSDSGIVTGVGEGKAIIEVLDKDGAMQTVSVTVSKTNEQIIADISELHIVCKSNLIVKGTYMTMECYSQSGLIPEELVEWSSSDTDIAYFSYSSNLRGRSLGTVTVTAKVGSKQCSRSIKVIDSSDPYIYTDTPFLTMDDDKNVPFTVTIQNTDSVTNTSYSVPNIASKQINSVCAGNPGSTEMTVSLSDRSYRSYSVTVYIIVKPVYDITSITLGRSSKERTLSIGETYDLEPSYVPECAVNNQLTFTTSSFDIATVDGNGVVTAVGYGTATITATAPSGVKATYSIKVPSDSDKEWSLPVNNKEENTFDLYVGETKNLNITEPPDGLIITQLYASSERVTISDDGTIKGLSVGKTAIYARLSNRTTYKRIVRVLPTEEYKQKVMKDARQQVLNDVNAERAKLGLSPLVMDDTLNMLADVRAKEMWEAQAISHTRPDGRKWSTVFTDYGVRNYYATIGENVIGRNIAFHKLVPMWMTSEAHKNAILSERNTLTGIGIYFSDEYCTGAYAACELFANTY